MPRKPTMKSLVDELQIRIDDYVETHHDLLLGYNKLWDENEVLRDKIAWLTKKNRESIGH